MLSRFAQLFTPPRRRAAALHCEELEPREVPAGIFVAGVGGVTQSADPEVSIYTTVGPKANQRIGIQLEAFGGTAGDARVAVGDVNGDGTDDVIVAAGKGGGSQVVIFDGKDAIRGTRNQIASFFVYSGEAGVSQNRGFDGGVFVASADLNGDGFAELITTPGLGGRGHLKVLDFNNGLNSFQSLPTLRASAYTFTDYNGEIRVTTMRFGFDTAIVTASGAGVAGDVRAYREAYKLGQIVDRTPVPSNFMIGRLVPFGGYDGGLSVAAGDTNGDLIDELFVSKNSGADVAVYDVSSEGFSGPSMPPLATFTAFAGFNGEVRLGAADINGDRRVEVLTTTGFSGDSNGTPVKAWSRSGNSFTLVGTPFYSNPGYQPGAWLAGREFTFATDLTGPRIYGAATSTPAPFVYTPANPDDEVTGLSDVGMVFPFGSVGSKLLPTETVTGGGLSFKGVEVTFSLSHPRVADVQVALRYDDGNPANRRSTTLFVGSPLLNAPGYTFKNMNITITDQALTIQSFTRGFPNGTAPDLLTGRYYSSNLSLSGFIDTLPTRNGTFTLIFEDTRSSQNGTVTAPARIRLLY